ncbi:MAG: argininosuccinate lyase [Clostridia bacterium]|nr:argininosuccinate lyase [Clostridia bacterium]
MSRKMWAGRTDGKTSAAADDFNSSIRFDCRMYEEDIRGSAAHAAMLADCGVISREDSEKILAGLDGILSDLRSGKLEIDPGAEDIHMFVESVLTERVGEPGKRLHTARSRNDQVALDMRMYLKKEINVISAAVKELIEALMTRAEENAGTVMPGYTHLQRAQPVTLGHHFMAYAYMLLRDLGRLSDARRRTDECPIGCCALAGTTFPTDRVSEAAALGFSGVAMNSLDGVSDRDFCVELLSAISMIMMHLSRLSEELVLWSSWEFGFIELSDAYTTGSSIMPQKKNSDMAERTRGKTGRVYGDLVSLLTTLKGLPLAYNKDMQEDKESVFDAIDTVLACLPIMTGMISTLTVRREALEAAAKKGFINATDLADYLVGKGVPFRDAYKISGGLVSKCSSEGRTLEDIGLDEFRAVCPGADEKIYEALDLGNCVNRRAGVGGPSPASVMKQIADVKEKIKKY